MGAHAAAYQRDLFRFLAALMVAGLISGTVVLGSVWWYRLTREMPHLASIQELSTRFGLEAVRLEEIAGRERIKPRARVNGEALYRPRDFGDPAWLLRAASGPAGDPGAMLRTARPATNSNSLPRPADSPYSADGEAVLTHRLKSD